MRVAILSSACCIHTRKWCNGLAERGIEVNLISQQIPMEGYHKDVIFHSLPFKGAKGYILNILALRKIIKKIKADVLNVHYASGYGTLANLAGLRDYIISVWGSDVYDFPASSTLKKKLITANLNKASIICSTSEVMGHHVKNYFNLRSGLDIEITPFGVDIDKFKPDKIKKENVIHIGTVKTLRPKYGIDLLIKAFSTLVNDMGMKNIRLDIAGVGYLKDELVTLTKELKIEDKVKFWGWVENNEVPLFLNKLDVYVAPSTLDSESFGVAIVEASSCGVPVIVTNVGGLPEVVIANVTGIVVPPNDYQAISSALRKLLSAPELAKNMGDEGRKHVLNKYSWNKCVDKMIAVYKRVLEGNI